MKRWPCCDCCRTLPNSVGCSLVGGAGMSPAPWVGHFEPCEEHQRDDD